MASSALPPAHSTDLKSNAVGVSGILFFVLSAQAPLTGVVGTAAVTIALGNGAGAPGAFVIVGVVLGLFAVGFTTIIRHIDARGGFFPIVSAGLGRRIGFGGSWLAVLAYQAIQTAMYALLGASAAGFAQHYWGWDVSWWVFALVAAAIVGLFGVGNIELGARVLSVLVLLEFVLLIVFAVVVLFQGGAHGLDPAGSFGFSAVSAGAPGIAIMFAMASMFGLESTAVYSAEAKDARRTVPRATYLSGTIITLFFAFTTWMLVAYYGPGEVMGAAGAALESGDASAFVVKPLVDTLGTWAGDAAAALLLTSLLAGLLAFHNLVNRYLHALAGQSGLPPVLARTNRQSAPHVAAGVQVGASVLTVAPFALLDQNPITTLFNWTAGVSITALMLLYCLASAAIIVFFRRNRVERSVWATVIAPALAFVLSAVGVLLILKNFDVLTGGSGLTMVVLLLVIPLFFVVGLATGGRAVSPESDSEQVAESSAT